ncbi:MAG: DeoR/GlpR family DNA-binding transcription regulator [Anaerolineae bacterium]|nr:DeoR/GlpR family DNA-binding transcription regulator [Anaerolineae bacterium]
MFILRPGDILTELTDSSPIKTESSFVCRNLGHVLQTGIVFDFRLHMLVNVVIMKIIETKRNLMMNPSRGLYLEERRQQVLRRLKEAGRVSVVELSQEFGVSEVTVRNDLQALADHKLIIRTHGGAILARTGLAELALANRRQQQVEEKNRIGEACVNLVANGDAIILDSSSTALAIAHQLKNHRHLTIVSNSVAVAQEMRDAPGVNVVLTGGRMRPETASLVGSTEFAMLRNFNIQKGFFGAHGITIEDGLTDVNTDEAEVKGWLASMCRQIVAVLDSTKWGQVGVVSFVATSQLSTVISDFRAPVDLVAQLRALETEVILV